MAGGGWTLGRLGLLAALLVAAAAKVGFIKDQSMDVKFPPPIQVNRVDGAPTGHLRPLGWQRKSNGAAEAVSGMLDPQELYFQYAKEGKPVKMEGALKDAPILTLWDNDDYLREKYGQVNVSVTIKLPRRKDFQESRQEVMKLRKFLLDYMYEDWHLASTVPAEMLEEIPFPRCVSCGTMSRFLQEAELWMSSGGTSSSLHSHQDHILHCVLFGRRDFILIEHPFHVNFDWRSKFEGSVAGHSPLNMEQINAYKYHRILDTPWHHATGTQADCIFIPAGYLHQVRSYGRSISFTLLIAPTPDFSDLDCEDEEQRGHRPLSQASLMWSFVGGVKQLTNVRLTTESLRHHLLALLRNDEKLPIEEFRFFYNDAMSISSSHPEADQVFAMLSPHGRRDLSRQDISGLDKERLQRVADILNSAHGSAPRAAPDHAPGHAHQEL